MTTEQLGGKLASLKVYRVVMLLDGSRIAVAFYRQAAEVAKGEWCNSLPEAIDSAIDACGAG